MYGLLLTKLLVSKSNVGFYHSAKRRSSRCPYPLKLSSRSWASALTLGDARDGVGAEELVPPRRGGVAAEVPVVLAEHGDKVPDCCLEPLYATRCSLEDVRKSA